MKQPACERYVKQKQPVGEYEELTDQYDPKSDVNGVATDGEDSGGDQLVRVDVVYSDPEAAAEGYQTDHQSDEACHAEKDPDPGHCCGLEEGLTSEGGPSEGAGKYDIEVDQHKRRYEEVASMGLANLHRADACRAHDQDAGDDDSQKEDEN